MKISKMAEKGSTAKFVFGQNMEARVCKDAPLPTVEIPVENGTEKTDARSPPLTPCSVVNKPVNTIPQACTPVQGHFVANKLLANPFATTSPVRHSFSTPNTSDSEDERKDRSLLAPGRLTTFSDKNSSQMSSIVLRPSALTPKAQNMGKGLQRPLSNEASPGVCEKSFILKPAKLHNPLAKAISDAPAKVTSSQAPSTGTQNNHKHFHVSNPFAKTIPDTTNSENVNPVCGSSSSQKSESNGHVTAEDGVKPVETSVSSSSSSSSSSSDKSKGAEDGASIRGFVFGSNISDRVVNATSGTTLCGSEPAENLFAQTSSPQASTPSVDPSPQSCDTTTSPEKSLVESAKEYQAKHALKDEYEEVECRTGEESESNVLHSNCKLFLFNKDSQAWTEKGRGLLRLNDMLPFEDGQSFQSRIIMRTQGSLKVILNTKIWSGMMIEKASLKSLRMTAQDEDGSIKVYLITTSPKEADHILTAVDWRIQQLKSQMPETTSGTPADESKMGEKRPADPIRIEVPSKKHRCEQKSSSAVDDLKPVREESNDSSTAEPETEASNSSSHSSPTIKSTSSE